MGILDKLFPSRRNQNKRTLTPEIFSFLRGSLLSGSLYNMSTLKGTSSYNDILSLITTMRALSQDAQICTALNYYATDATTPNANGDIIWATALDSDHSDVADVINSIFKRWHINEYVRDHILELATVGNLYIPTTHLYKPVVGDRGRTHVVLDNNTIPDDFFDIVPSTKILPENILHLWHEGEPVGYLMEPNDTDSNSGELQILSEVSCIHFSLGGILGDYTLDAKDGDGNDITYDIKFATPLLSQAIQPTQILNLLEDANILSSLSRVVKFVNVECGTNEADIREALTEIKNAIEQQLALNTSNGDIQSYVNPQSPNNLIYLPRINGTDAVSVTDLNMAESNEADNNLLDYYQNKKLSVLGVPKEALNFSSNEGLGGAGTVLSQRSALYANALQRLETAYINGWTDAFNKYFTERNLSGYVNSFTLHMNPIVTPLSTVMSEKRDSAISQAQNLIQMLKELGVTESELYKDAITEILSETFPKISSSAYEWDINVEEGEEGGGPIGGGF